MIKLRDYQQEGKDLLYRNIQSGISNNLFWCQTGSGKSVVESSIIADAIASGGHAVLAVRRRELIKQMSGHMDKWGISHGVYMAGHHRYRPSERVQICSIDTLASRDIAPHSDKKNTLVIVDECFSADTEILTENGFIRFDQLGDEMVAQVDENNGIDFVKPLRRIKKPLDSRMLLLESSNNCSIMATENHDMITEWGHGRKVKFKDIKSHYKMYSSGYSKYRGDDELTFLEKFAIAYQADGSCHYDRINKKGMMVAFSFKKKRKLDEFKKLMASSDSYFTYQTNGIDDRGRTRLFVDLDFKIPKTIDCLFDISKMSLLKAKAIIEYMNIWDGHVVSKNYYLYTTTNKRMADFYQEISALCGYKTKLVKVVDSRSENYSDCYRLFINKSKNTFGFQKNTPKEVEYCGDVYCVTVPTGAILLRRNGKTFISGNCHDCTPRSSKYVKFMESYSGPKIGFTATPFSDNSMWNAIVKPIEAHELRDLGYLVPDRTFVPNIIDVSGVRINRGEFNEQELFEASSTSEIVGDFIRDWQLYAQGRPTVLFAINVDHSKLIAEAFNSAGIKAVHADATTPSRERDSILKKLASGVIFVLTNVNIFSTGVDVPEIAAIQLCRPTQSLIWFLQAIGRGLRPSPSTGKQNCIIIDNAGNTLRHGTAYRVREAELGRQRRQVVEMDEESVSIKRCQRCNYVYEPKEKECPNCGFVNPAQERRINQRDGDLVEYQMSEEEKAALVKKSFVSDYHKIKFVANTKLKRNNKTQWIRERLEEKYGFTVCKQYGEIINLEF